MARPSKPVDVKRNSRINLAFTADLKKQLEDLASIDEVSTNALVEKICLAYVESRSADLDEYQQFRAQIREKNSAADDEP
ncbi:MAG: hypothetical protein IJG33_13905 [Selenomonadaceae bacterium]|nr:hypothetical protein [Selenomonadaceae bacterium]